MDANVILTALTPATKFILDCLKKNDDLAKVLKKAGLDTIEELPEDPLKAKEKLEERFDPSKLLEELQQTFAAGTKSQPIKTGDLEATALVAQVLLDIQRYYRWRGLSYGNRVVRAACRRTINAATTGPVQKTLQQAIQQTLKEANSQ